MRPAQAADFGGVGWRAAYPLTQTEIGPAVATLIIGRGKTITARLTTLEYGSETSPWLVYRSSDSGIWPIAAMPTKNEAELFAALCTVEEDDRCKLINKSRLPKKQTPREYFDDYFVKPLR